MSIEKAKFNQPDLSERDLPERYRQPGIFTTAGQLDRQHEGKHVVRMRDMQRDAIESAAAEAKREFELNAWMECRGRTLTDAKYKLHRVHKETQFLAGEDPLLQAQFAMLDDDYFKDMKFRFEDWR